MALSGTTTLADVHAILAADQDKVDKLRVIEPCLIDLSLRENPVGARMGQTLQDKLRILPKLRGFGFRHVHLGTVDYALPDELETDDDFMASLRDGPDRFMDLAPEVIGGRYGFRICPTISDGGVIAGRLAEVMGGNADDFDESVTERMIRLTRRDLRAGKRIVYEPGNPIDLHSRASAKRGLEVTSGKHLQLCGQAGFEMTIDPSRQEADSDIYKTLVESTKAIPWTIDWETRKFTYIGPQIEALLGWTPESWASVEDWVERMHPEDRASVVAFCVAQSEAGTDHEADYRALTRDGDYVWIRDVVHVVRDEHGNVASLVGFMFDIRERKRNEEKLAELQKALEKLSYKDDLTGIANRRMVDSVMEKEWLEAGRKRQPLSLIILDIDYFKQYNDHYGHLRGDECLRRVAQALLAASTRASDFLGRFGGEEFILILPDTDAQSAVCVAERCRKLILDQGIAHERSGIGEVLTISAGVATIVPSESGERVEFIELVDKRLYQAKLGGRNRIVGGSARSDETAGA